MLVRIANRETLIRLLLKKQSDLGLPCLPRPSGQATSARKDLRQFPIQSAQISTACGYDNA